MAKPAWNGKGPTSITRVIRLQEAADETDLRALILQWMRDSFPLGGHGDDRVQALRRAAAELRRTASFLLATASLEAESPGTDRTD